MAIDNSISSDLIRGHIDTIILRSLYDGDKHVNEICLDIEDKSGGQYELKMPTLYSALKRLEATGLIVAYWSSGVGQRRRYYKLTDEGRRVCDDNFDIWVHSRNIIDKLISNGSDLGYPVYEPKAPRPKFDPSEYEGYTFGTDFTEETAATDDMSEPEVQPIEFDDFSNETSDEFSIVGNVGSDAETISSAKDNEDNLGKLGTEDFDVTQLSLIGGAEAEDNSQEDAPEEPAEEPEEDTDEEIIIEVSVPVEDTEQEEFVAATDTHPDDEPIGDGIDDSLVLEPYSTPKREYTEILESLFPYSYYSTYSKTERRSEPEPEPVKQTYEPSPEPEQPAVEPEPEEDYAVERPSPVTVYGDSDREEAVEKTKKTEENSNPNEIDYTDIISLAKMQGFNVKPSDRTNHVTKGRLLINRVVAFSAFILYIIIAIEAAAVLYATNDILRFSYETLIYAGLALALFPIIACAILVVAPNRAVNKFPTMQYSVSASIVVMLNLMLVTFALILLFNIDLTVTRNLFLYIVLPFILYLDLPLYYIIKYALISSGAFIREE